MNEQVWWYLARSSGIVALVLLFAGVVWGVLLTTRVFKPHDRPAWLLDLHRWLGGMALVMTGLHLLGLFLDGYIDFGPGELFVPGVSPYRTFAVAIGILSLYVMIAVQVTSYMRRWLSKRVWHGIHLLSYGLVWGAAIHAGLAGTDVPNRLYQGLALALTVVAVVATGVRIRTPARADRAPRPRMSRGGPPSVEVSADETVQLGHRPEPVRQ
jgi:DMSO/TMAO reductase YedYZ heme-binding membrane subunit